MRGRAGSRARPPSGRCGALHVTVRRSGEQGAGAAAGRARGGCRAAGGPAGAPRPLASAQRTGPGPAAPRRPHSGRRQAPRLLRAGAAASTAERAAPRGAGPAERRLLAAPAVVAVADRGTRGGRPRVAAALGRPLGPRGAARAGLGPVGGGPGARLQLLPAVDVAGGVAV